MSDEEKMREEKEGEDEEISVDFSKIGGKVSGFFKRNKKRGKEEIQGDIKGKEEMKVDIKEEGEKKQKEEIKVEIREGKGKQKEEVEIDVKDEKEEVKIDVKPGEEKDEEISVDFSKVKKLFIGKKEKTDAKESSDEKEEISVDFKKIGSTIKNWAKAQKGGQKEDSDIAGAYKFFSKHKRIIIPLILVIFVAFLAVYFRIGPMSLSFTDEWADNSVNSLIQTDINNWVSQNYPNLPQAQREGLVRENFDEAMRTGMYEFKAGQYAGQLMDINDQKKQFSTHFKTFYQYGEGPNEGKSYMPDIDPYYWYRYAANIIDHGHPGDELRDGQPWDTHQLAPNGRPVAKTDWFHPYFLAYFYQVIGPLTGATLLRTMMYYPLIISVLTVIIIFFIARRVAGNLGGVFAASMAALSQAFASRTLFGHADSDAWALFFPVVISLLFIEAFISKNIKKQVILAALSGFFVGIYSFSWGGWWYIYDFILATIIIYAAYYLIIHYKELRNFEAVKKSALKDTAIIAITFLIFSGIFVTVFNDFTTFTTAPVASLGFASFKDPVLATLWPNVLTTVAELNEGSIDQIIGNVGGTAIVWMALLGMLLTLSKKTPRDTAVIIVSAVWWIIVVGSLRNLSPMVFIALLSLPIGVRVLIALFEKDTKIDLKYAMLFTLWLLGSIYAATKGIRFTLVLIPALAIGFGITFGSIYEYLSKPLSKGLQINKRIINSFLVIVLIIFFLIMTWGMAKSTLFIGDRDVPIINDAWYNSLAAIKEDSQPNAIITSWWDFGHHFKALADRAVTFDGTTQETPRAHWVGKTLLTDSEDQAIGILRMIDCGGNNAFDELYEKNQDTHESIEILYDIIVMDKSEAKTALTDKYGVSDADAVLQYTHCDPPEGYFIASQDMIHKAGVWSHFGSWDFERAAIVKDVKRAGFSEIEAINYMQQKFDYPEETARNIYNELQTLITNADENQWVAPWPGYQSSAIGCSIEEEKVTCPQYINTGGGDVLINIIIDKSNMQNITIPETDNLKPNSLVYATADSVEEITFENDVTGFSVILVPSGENFYSVLSSPALANSMFTRMFFFEGHGLRHFKPLTHEISVTQDHIYVYKIDWDGSEPSIMPTLKPKEIVTAGDTVKANYIGYFEDGKVFDSSIGLSGVTKDTPLEGITSQPIEFVAGSGQLIPGFDEAVIGMRINEEKTIAVPPEKGYGTDPTTVPEGLRNLANKTLYFKIKIVEIK